MTDASTQRPDLTDELTATLQERILVIDGAMPGSAVSGSPTGTAMSAATATCSA